MKGLQQYIEKHGKHFTVELAEAAIKPKWSSEDIEKAANKKVYYNVTESTMGDIIFLVNLIYYCDWMPFTKNDCIDFALSYVGDFKWFSGALFSGWTDLISKCGFDFDFSKYI